MDTGAWIALAAVTITSGQVMAEAIRRRRKERIDDLEAKVKDLTAAQERCEAKLKALIDWIRLNVPGLPPVLLETGK